MSEARYNVILTGHIQAGQHHTAVAARLAALMKQPQEKTANLLQGRASRVKSDLDAASAQRYQAALEKTGAQVELQQQASQPQAPASVHNGDSSTPSAAPNPALQLEPVSTPQPAAAAAADTPYSPPTDDHLHPDEIRYCSHCGGEAPRLARICPHCRRRLPTLGRSREVAAVLALLPTGSWGFHRFYLGQWWGIFYLLFSWTLIPSLVSLIEFIVFLCTSREKWDEKHGHKSGSSLWIWVVLGLFMMVMLLGVLAAVAIPAYQDYLTRAQVNLTLLEADTLEDEIEAFIERTGFVPNSALDMGKDDPGQFTHGSWVITDNAVITVTFDDSASTIRGETLTLVPYQEPGGLIWDCTGGTVEPEYRPQECRP